MRDPQWETTARLRYLVAPTSEPELQCVCGATLRNEEFCVHALDCKVKGKTQASRHKEVKEAFRNLLVHYGFKPDLCEPRFDNGRGAEHLLPTGTEARPGRCHHRKPTGPVLCGEGGRGAVPYFEDGGGQQTAHS